MNKKMRNKGWLIVKGEEILKKTKVVIYPSVARQLVKMGYQIIDLKPKKENRKKTLFIFEVTGDFMQDFSMLMKNLSEKE